jgi:hypothetical protein
VNKEPHRFTINQHFEGKEEVVRKSYDELLRILRSRGPVIESAKKSSIHLLNATTLAGVSTRKNYLILTIKSDRELTSPRIRKSERVSLHCFHLKLKIASPEDVNDELKGWLDKAYSLSASQSAKPGNTVNPS